MKKGTLIGLIIYIALFCVFYLVFTSQTLVFEAFQVKAKTTDVFTEENNEAVTYSNLICVRNGECILTLMGWLKLAMYFILIPFMFAWLFARRINRKIARKKEFLNNQNSIKSN